MYGISVTENGTFKGYVQNINFTPGDFTCDVVAKPTSTDEILLFNSKVFAEDVAIFIADNFIINAVIVKEENLQLVEFNIITTYEAEDVADVEPVETEAVHKPFNKF